MPGTLRTWPAWPEYAQQSDKGAQDPDNVQAKREIIAEYGEEALTRAWKEACKTLKEITDDIALHGRDLILDLKADDVLFNGLSVEQTKSLRNTGCCIVRGLLKQDEARQHYAELQNYVKDNHEHIQGWPESSPSMLSLYDSPTQIAIRTDPRHLKLQRILNTVWSGYAGDISANPLLYTDGVRDRPSGQSFLGLGPHIDAGSLARWADPAYRRVYAQIFSGHPELHDSFDIQKRAIADQFRFPGPAHSTVLRTFQGWTALTRTGSSEGSIKLYPNVSTAIAYVLLRPFFRPPTDKADIMDATKWTFDADGSWFPGTMKPQSQYLSPSSHPHLRLKECLIDLPVIDPGDTVWWHADVSCLYFRLPNQRNIEDAWTNVKQMCHAVDPEHLGRENASVVYIAACPSTPTNRTYIKKQLESALSGRPPPDQQANTTVNETTFKGYTGYKVLDAHAKSALGFDLL